MDANIDVYTLKAVSQDEFEDVVVPTGPATKGAEEKK